MKKAIIGGLILSAVFPLLANAGIFSSRNVVLKSTCASADGKYSANYKYTVIGKKNTWFTSGEVLNQITEFNLKNKVTGKEYRYYQTEDYKKQNTLEGELDFDRQGQSIYVNISVGGNRTELVELFCKDIPKSSTNDSSVPGLTLHLPKDFFAGLTDPRYPQYGYEPTPTFVGGKVLNFRTTDRKVSYEKFGQKTIGACELITSKWETYKGSGLADNQAIQFSYGGKNGDLSYYSFKGATKSHQYTLVCTEEALGSVAGYKESYLDGTIDGALTSQQVKNLILKAFPPGMVSFTK